MKRSQCRNTTKLDLSRWSRPGRNAAAWIRVNRRPSFPSLCPVFEGSRPICKQFSSLLSTLLLSTVSTRAIVNDRSILIADLRDEHHNEQPRAPNTPTIQILGNFQEIRFSSLYWAKNGLPYATFLQAYKILLHRRILRVQDSYLGYFDRQEWFRESSEESSFNFWNWSDFSFTSP